MINVVNVADLALVGYNLARDIKAKEKELVSLKEAFRQIHGAGSFAYHNGVIVEIAPSTKRLNLQRKPVEEEIGMDRLIEIGALIEVPVLPAVRFRR